MTTMGRRARGVCALLVVAALWLAGCTGSSPTSPLAIEVSQSATCVESIENQPAFAPLRAKSPALGDMSSTHLGDTAKPTRSHRSTPMSIGSDARWR